MNHGASSDWQFLLAMACQLEINPIQPVVSQIDKGRENQRLKSEKQCKPETALELSLWRTCFQRTTTDPRGWSPVRFGLLTLLQQCIRATPGLLPQTEPSL